MFSKLTDIFKELGCYFWAIVGMIGMLLLLVLVMTMFTACNPWTIYKTTETVVQNYPSDNIVEEIAEEYIEDYLEVEEGSIDLSPFSPEK